jgi:hypothetical protein
LSKMKDLPKALSLMDDSRKEINDAVILPLTVGDFQKKHKSILMYRLWLRKRCGFILETGGTPEKCVFRHSNTKWPGNSE